MYLGILSKLLVNREFEVLEEATDKEDQTFINVLLDLVDRPDIQKIMKQHQNAINLKKVTQVLDLKGVKSLLTKSPLSNLVIEESDSKLSNDFSNDSPHQEKAKLDVPVNKFELNSIDGKESFASFKKSQIIKMPMHK